MDLMMSGMAAKDELAQGYALVQAGVGLVCDHGGTACFAR